MILQKNCAGSQLLLLDMDLYPLTVFPRWWHLLLNY